MIKWLLRLVVGAAAVGSVVLLVLAFGDFRRELLIGTVGLAVPLVLYFLVSAVLSRRRQARWSGRALALLAAAFVALAFVGAAGGYRAWVWSTCLERLGPGGDLHGCDLRGELLEKTNLSGADLSAAELSGVQLSRADLRDADLRDARLRGADLSKADLRGADLSSADVSEASLGKAKLREAVARDASFAGADLSYADLTSVEGSRARLARAKLHSAILVSANLSEVIGTGADFRSASLVRADLAGANLTGANLTRVDASGADFLDATLRRVALKEANLEGATGLTDAMLSSALSVAPLDLAGALWQRRLYLERPGEIASTLGAACRGKPVRGAATSSSRGIVLVAVRQNGRVGPSVRWKPQPVALRFGEVVACLGPKTTTTIQVCTGYVYTETNRPAPNIRRYQEQQHVRLVLARTAKLIGEQTVYGPYPEPCPYFTFETTQGKPLGGRAVSQAIAAMLSEAGLET